jgi:hypothetical protein
MSREKALKPQLTFEALVITITVIPPLFFYDSFHHAHTTLPFCLGQALIDISDLQFFFSTTLITAVDCQAS